MKLPNRLAFAALATVALPASICAFDTVTFSDGEPTGALTTTSPTDWSANHVLPQYGGVPALQFIYIQWDRRAVDAFSIDIDDAGIALATPVTVGFSISMDLTVGPTTLNWSGSNPQNFFVNPNDGDPVGSPLPIRNVEPDGFPDAGNGFLDYISGGTDVTTTVGYFVPPADWALFIGGGSINLPIAADATTSFSGPSVSATLRTTRAASLVTITYAYVPEPAPLAVAGGAGLLIGADLWRRRRQRRSA